MTKNKFIYDYPRPMVTVDAVLLAALEDRPQVLLIRRATPPFAETWALPGGFVEMEETLEEAVARELLEETGVHGVELHQFHTFGEPHRDPRGRNIAVAYVGQVDAPLTAEGADDALAARWWPVNALPPLAFDHQRIIEHALAALKEHKSHAG